MTKGEKLQIQKQVGLRIALARDIAGMTQQELSAAAGVGRPQIANLEAGRSDMPVCTLVRIARGLGIKPGKLLP